MVTRGTFPVTLTGLVFEEALENSWLDFEWILRIQVEVIRDSSFESNRGRNFGRSWGI